MVVMSELERRVGVLRIIFAFTLVIREFYILPELSVNVHRNWTNRNTR